MHLLRPSRAPAFIRALPPPEPLCSRPAWGLRPLTNLPVLGSRSLPFPSCHSSALSTQFCESPHRPTRSSLCFRTCRYLSRSQHTGAPVSGGESREGEGGAPSAPGRGVVAASFQPVPPRAGEPRAPSSPEERPSLCAGTPGSPGNSPQGAPPDSGRAGSSGPVSLTGGC